MEPNKKKLTGRNIWENETANNLVYFTGSRFNVKGTIIFKSVAAAHNHVV